MSVKATKAIQVLLFIAACILFVYGAFQSNKAAEQRALTATANAIEITIPQKENKSYNDRYTVCNFTFVFKNNGTMTIDGIKGLMTIKDANDQLLSSGEASFSGSFAVGSETRFTLSWEMQNSDSSIDIWNSDLRALEISFQITQIYVENSYSGKEVSTLNQPVKPLNTEYVESTYNAAIAYANNCEYEKAAELFQQINNYKDSKARLNQAWIDFEQAKEQAREEAIANIDALVNEGKFSEALTAIEQLTDYENYYEKTQEIIDAAVAKAEELADSGDYIGACNTLEQIEYTETRTYTAYYYAAEGYYADAVKYGLTNLVIPEGIENIPDNYFYDSYYGCSLERIVLPSTLKTIGKNAFRYCNYLREITIPAGVTSIGSNAFDGCYVLQKAYFEDTAGWGTDAGESLDVTDPMINASILTYGDKLIKAN